MEVIKPIEKFFSEYLNACKESYENISSIKVIEKNSGLYQNTLIDESGIEQKVYVIEK